MCRTAGRGGEGGRRRWNERNGVRRGGRRALKALGVGSPNAGWEIAVQRRRRPGQNGPIGKGSTRCGSGFPAYGNERARRHPIPPFRPSTSNLRPPERPLSASTFLMNTRPSVYPAHLSRVERDEKYSKGRARSFGIGKPRTSRRRGGLSLTLTISRNQR